jgi:hypothetical protein
MRFPFGAFGYDRHVDGRALLKRAGIAIHSNDLIGVAVAGLGAVVEPLKRLERVHQAGILAARCRMRYHAFEHLGARHPVGLIFSMIRALNGKATQAIAHRVRDIQA